MSPHRFLATTLAVALLLASCGSTSSENNTSAPDVAETSTGADEAPAGIRLVSPAEGAAIQADPPDDLVVLDVRTPEEFAEGHLEGAILVDFYDPDFKDQLAELDPDASYLLYCRSGNRSGQTAPILGELGFTDVADINGGVIAWGEAGLTFVNE